MMFLYDFLIFYNGGRAVWAGLSPHTVADFNGPYPLAVLFAPLALLPLPVAYGLFLAFNLYLVWRVLHWSGAWALLSFPVLFSLFVGQIDLALTLGIAAVPWLLPLALVKPQVGFVLAPWLVRRYTRCDWQKAIGVGVVFLALCFALRPGWVGEWLAAQPQVNSYSIRASNLYYLIPAQAMDARVIAMTVLAPLALIAAFLLKERKVSWTAASLLAPLTNIYSPAVLAEWIGPLEMGVSYLPVLLTGGVIHEGMPMYLIGLVILARQFWPQLKWKTNHRGTETQRRKNL